MLAGRLRCIDCRATWGAVWNMKSLHPICHECGGTAIPIDVQRTQVSGWLAIDAECMRLEDAAVRRTMS
jgi:hypothetical protein